ncbi:MAG: S-layer homology domain-containing protein, partial [Oscillospiraceae bacterium]|nr:S-layer homology domain-containing protein [Oscillospiraceae bacterium]
IEKIDMANMPVDEKLQILDKLPLGASLCFSGHEMMYLGKVNGKHYVISTVSSIMSPETGKRLRTRDVMINTLDVKRANGQTWLEALNMAFMPCYPTMVGKTYDFPQTQWYREGVGYVLKNKLISNYENGEFRPNNMASRETVVNALWCLEGKPEATVTDKFTDVSAEENYISAIYWADANGIAGGYGDGRFGPEDTLTREQMVAILWRYAQWKGYDVSVGEDTNILSYEDASKVSSYAVSALQWACGSGLIAGSSSATGMVLNPKNKTTRAHLAVVLMRFDAQMK